MNLPIDVKKTGNYLVEQVTKTLPRIYSVNYDKLWGLDPAQNWVNSIGDLPLGIDFIDVWMRENLGQIPALYDGTSDDIPVVDVEIGKKTYKAVMFALATHWNLIDIEKERNRQDNGTNIPSMNLITAKQDGVGDFFNRGEHYTTLYGYPKVGVRGLFSQAGISFNDASFAPYIKSGGAYTLSTAQLYEDLTDIIWTFKDRAKLSSVAQVKMMVPPRLNRRMVEVYKTTAGESVGMTLKQMLMSSELGLGINAIEERAELAGSNLNQFVLNDSNTAPYPVNRDRILFQATVETPQRHFYARRQFPPFQYKTLTYEQVTLSASTGIINIYPEYSWYYDFNNATS